jgi:DNA invertase Pin-like site-specific DNA recombinase
MRTIGVNERGLRVGEDHQRAVLTNFDVDLMRMMRADGVAYSHLARIFECSKSQVVKICLFQVRNQRATDWLQVSSGSVPLDEPAMVSP